LRILTGFAAYVALSKLHTPSNHKATYLLPPWHAVRDPIKRMDHTASISMVWDGNSRMSLSKWLSLHPINVRHCLGPFTQLCG